MFFAMRDSHTTRAAIPPTPRSRRRRGSATAERVRKLRVEEALGTCRRIPGRETMCRETAAGVKGPNEKAKTVKLHFTTRDARIKLRSLSPIFQKW